MDQKTIFSVAESCEEAFTKLLDSDPLLQAENIELAEALEDDKAQFKLWATHIGAFAEYHASLDYRLRESENVRQLLLSQLDILARSLRHLFELLNSGELLIDSGRIGWIICLLSQTEERSPPYQNA